MVLRLTLVTEVINFCDRTRSPVCFFTLMSLTNFHFISPVLLWFSASGMRHFQSLGIYDLSALSFSIEHRPHSSNQFHLVLHLPAAARSMTSTHFQIFLSQYSYSWTLLAVQPRGVHFSRCRSSSNVVTGHT